MCHNSIFEQNGGTYIKTGDYYVPNFGQFDDEPEQEEIPLVKYAPARKAYLQQHHKAIYNHLLLTGKLQSHLRETQKQALHMLDELIPKLAKQQGVTNELKMQNQMQWVGMMNNIKAQVDEIIFSEIVYVDYQTKE